MDKFLFVPPVYDSLGPLKAKQWFWLSASFLSSIVLIVLAQFIHRPFSGLMLLAIVVTALPMQIYTQNRKGRMVGKILLAAAFGVALYHRWDWINAHTFESSLVVFVVLSVGWLTWCIDNSGNLILKRMEVLQRRVDSVESKLERIDRSLGELRSEAKEAKQ